MQTLSSFLNSEVLEVAQRVALVVLGVVAAVLLIWLIRQVYKLYYSLKSPVTVLELTPPARGDKTIAATAQLFQALHGLGGKRLIDRMLGREHRVSLEIAARKETGIRYFLRVSQDLAEPVEHLMSAYMPDVKVAKVEEPKPPLALISKVFEYRQSHHFAYPLSEFTDLSEHDPMSYITNAMTKLEKDEQITWQLVVKPVQMREAASLSRKIMSNEDLMPRLHSAKSLLGKATTFLNRILFAATDLVGGAYHSGSQEAYRAQHKELEYKQQVAKGIKPARTLSYFEHELVESIHRKLEQPLYETSVRTLVQVSTKKHLYARRRSVESALTVFSVPKNQHLKLIKLHHYVLHKYSTWLFGNRLPALFNAHRNIFSVSELASLYHFPNTVSAKTENVVKALSKTLPAPVSLKSGKTLDVLFGENVHQGNNTPIGLTEAERQRHAYIIGGTGNGKTTMLLYAILQDIKNGKGLAVLDPHGDLAETILHHIPDNRVDDVIYLNPDDLTHPIGINLLEMTPGLEGDDLLREKDLITESTISVLRKIFSDDDTGGHRIEYVLRNTIQTALTLENPTLFTIFKLLNDNKYRREAVKTLEDEDLKNFWKNELGKAGDFQKVKMVAGITAKVGRFLFSASAKRILEQEKSTIDFSDVLDNGKILICNFSKGLLGEDTSTLFGTTILAKLQVAALRRARLKQTERRAFYLYVDEFQNFATMSFVQMLSEARKYKLFLTMAEQSTSQQDQQRLVDIILANVGTVICFRSGSPADERYVLPLFYPYIEQSEIANLPAYNFYMRIAAVEAQEPLSGVTVLIDTPASEHVYKLVTKNSRKRYAKKAIRVSNPKSKIKPKQKSALTQANLTKIPKHKAPIV